MSYGMQLDMSMDIMEETRLKKKHSALIRKLSKELHFTYAELEAIMLIYYKLQKSRRDKRKGISKNQIWQFLHSGLDMTDSELTNKMLDAMIYCRGSQPIVSMEMWARLLSLLLRGTVEEKIKHCFAVYDNMNTGRIGRDAMLGFLEDALIGQDEDAEDAVKDMIEVLTKKLDLNRDAKICFDDYRKSCIAQPLLLECLGQCLPTRLAAYSFLTTFTTKTGKL